MGTLRVGTSGFSYSSWRGTFYPRKLKAEAMISYYATRLNTVEVNTTFYRTQPNDVIASWAAAVPEGFRFAVKAHRRITHNRRMPNLEQAMRTLCDQCGVFGERLGPVLFQLPPTAPFEEGRIERIMSQVPSHWRVAFQFRHPSWHTPAVADLIERMGAAFVHGDGEDQPGPVGRGGFLYVRMRRDSYSSQRLAAWSRRIDQWLAGGRDVYVYLKHERLGPLYAERLVRRYNRGEFRAKEA